MLTALGAAHGRTHNAVFSTGALVTVVVGFDSLTQERVLALRLGPMVRGRCQTTARGARTSDPLLR